MTPQDKNLDELKGALHDTHLSDMVSFFMKISPCCLNDNILKISSAIDAKYLKSYLV